MVDGVCVNEDGNARRLDLDMARAVRNAAAMLQIDVPTAIAIASLSPARFLGMEAGRGRIAPGLAADLVLLDDDLHVREAGSPAAICLPDPPSTLPGDQRHERHAAQIFRADAAVFRPVIDGQLLLEPTPQRRHQPPARRQLFQ